MMIVGTAALAPAPEFPEEFPELFDAEVLDTNIGLISK